MDSASFLIKPASGRCNLRCKYCFYEDVMENRETGDFGMMSVKTLEAIVSKGFTEAQHHVSFAFQGGEPMLRGLDFYRELIRLEGKYMKPGLSVHHSIQTNGTLINDEWAEFFKENNFLVGLSLDGTKEIHDTHRLTSNGKGTWKAVSDAYALLNRCGVETNLLCVVTGALARKGQAVYSSLKKLGCRYIQFIPCIEPLGHERGQMSYSLKPERYAGFLKSVFDLWYKDWENGDYVSVRLFDDYVHLLCGRPSGTCSTDGSCGQYFTVEGDGSVYPCDFFVLDCWNMGNINDKTLSQLAASDVSEKFLHEGRCSLLACKGCAWHNICKGGCRREHIGASNYHCVAIKSFFEYAMPRLKIIARQELAYGG